MTFTEPVKGTVRLRLDWTTQEDNIMQNAKADGTLPEDILKLAE